jgi:hypothetical protein
MVDAVTFTQVISKNPKSNILYKYSTMIPSVLISFPWLTYVNFYEHMEIL